MAAKKRGLRSLFLKNQDGAAIIEFALVGPLFLIFVFAIMDIGAYYFTTAQMQNAVQQATRLIRTGQTQGQNIYDTDGNITDATTRDEFRRNACNNIVPVLVFNCTSTLRVDVRPYETFDPAVTSTAFDVPDGGDGTIADNDTRFDTGGSNCAVVARIFYEYKPMLPGISLLMQGLTKNPDAVGPIPAKSYITAAASFRNEPFIGGTGDECAFY